MPLLTSILALALASTAGCTTIDANPRLASSDSLSRLFGEGIPFSEFLAKAKSNKDEWRTNYETAQVPDSLVTRVRAARGPWKLLVVAVAGCSDSRSTIPYIARLAELSGVELRIIDSDKGSGIMKAHRTPDGRAATPTVVLLNADGKESGCWVERPSALVKLLADRKDGDGKVESKMDWYRQDKGRETVREIVEIIETAAAGGSRCT